MERGWCLGDAAFKTELLAQVQERRGDHYGAELREADEAHAESIVLAELGRRGWREGELALRRKGDPEQVKIAGRLRLETAMTLPCIARRSKMGAWRYVSNCLAHARKK